MGKLQTLAGTIFSLAFFSLLQADEMLPKERIDAILAMEGDPLIAAIHQTLSYDAWKKVAPADRLRLLERVVRESGKFEQFGQSTMALGWAVAAVTMDAQSEDLDQIVEMLKDLPDSEVNVSAWFIPVVQLAIRRELARIAAEGTPAVKLTPSKDPEPPRLKELSPELQEGWRSYKALMASDLDGQMKESQPQIAYQTNRHAFAKLLYGILSGTVPNASQKLDEYTWGGFCGTGSEIFVHPRAYARVLALLQERNLPAAAAAALRVPVNSFDYFQFQNSINLLEAPLQSLGLNWEVLSAAQAADVLISDEKMMLWMGNALPLQMLGMYGTEKGAALLLELLSLGPGEQNLVITTLATMTEVPRPFIDRRVELSKAGKEMIIAGFIARMTPQSGVEELRPILQAVRQLKPETAKPALRGLLNHWSDDITSIAADLLRSMGEEVETPKAQGPVHFQLVTNGSPIRKMKVEVSISYDEAKMTTSTTAECNDRGEVELNRELFLEPGRKPSTITFNSGGRFGDTRVLEPDAQLAFFDVTVPIPADLNSVTPVPVTGVPLRLNLDFAGVKVPELLELQFESLNRASPMPFRTTLKVKAAPVITLPGVTPGKYQLTLNGAGLATWKKEEFAVQPEGSEVRIKCAPGADLNLELADAAGKKIYAPFHLTRRDRPGQDIYEQRGLAVGKYLLRIPSSDQLAKEFPGRSDGVQVDPMPKYREVKMEFEVSKDSPPVIDLGVIRLSQKE